MVHARLDARIALRSPAAGKENYRRAAQIALIVMACAAVAALVLKRGWIALALLVAVAGYAYDLRAQQNAGALQLPLKSVGQRALALSSLFAVLLIAGFW